jgi:hypothetical protein
LPYRFITAARHAPKFEPQLEAAFYSVCAGLPKLSGRTVGVIDVSGSMGAQVSGRSEINRLDAGIGLLMVLREMCEDLRVFSYDADLNPEIPARRGFGLRDAIYNETTGGWTRLGAALTTLHRDVDYERIVVVTDEQTADKVASPKSRDAYVINVASFKNGVGYYDWTHIDGFSEATVKFIAEVEGSE